jgi:hypothetical protein
MVQRDKAPMEYANDDAAEREYASKNFEFRPICRRNPPASSDREKNASEGEQERQHNRSQPSTRKHNSDDAYHQASQD